MHRTLLVRVGLGKPLPESEVTCNNFSLRCRPTRHWGRFPEHVADCRFASQFASFILSQNWTQWPDLQIELSGVALTTKANSKFFKARDAKTNTCCEKFVSSCLSPAYGIEHWNILKPQSSWETWTWLDRIDTSLNNNSNTWHFLNTLKMVVCLFILANLVGSGNCLEHLLNSFKFTFHEQTERQRDSHTLPHVHTLEKQTLDYWITHTDTGSHTAQPYCWMLRMPRMPRCLTFLGWSRQLASSLCSCRIYTRWHNVCTHGLQ